MAAAPPAAHFIFASFPSWGHTRTELYLAFNLLELFPSLHITFLAVTDFAPNIPKETDLFDPSESVRSRIRIVALGKSGFRRSDWEPQYLTFLEDLKPWLLSLPSEISPSEPGDGFSKRPTLAVVDILIEGWTNITRDLSADPSNQFAPIRSLAYASVPAAWNLWRMTKAPGIKRFRDLKNDPKNASVPVEELLRQTYLHTDGSVMEIEGVGKAYDYELLPQAEAVPFDGHWLNFIFDAGSKIRNFSGIVLTTPPDIEPGLQSRIAEELNGVCLHVGPQFPPLFWARRTEKANKDESIVFLDECEKLFGPKSVVYISFGSLYSPSQRPDLLETLVESLLSVDPPFPFLFATATIGHVISDRVRKLVADSGGRAMITGFSPQLHVLQHRATGWFLTHGGAGSVAESIINRVPMVLWPCMTDQPFTSMNVTLNFKLSFELIQVRTGPGANKPTYRGIQHENSLEAVKREMAETWKHMRGPEGDAMRERVEKMGERFEQSWRSGLARENMHQFKQFF